MLPLLGKILPLTPSNIYYRFLIVLHDDIGEILEQPQLILNIILVIAFHESICLYEQEFDDLFFKIDLILPILPNLSDLLSHKLDNLCLLHRIILNLGNLQFDIGIFKHDNEAFIIKG